MIRKHTHWITIMATWIVGTLVLGCGDSKAPSSTAATLENPEPVMAEASLHLIPADPGYEPIDGILIHSESWKEDHWGICSPDCAGRTCGPDKCGGFCGVCDDQAFCTQIGLCISVALPPDSCMSLAPCLVECDWDVACMKECGEGEAGSVTEVYDPLVDCLYENCTHCTETPEDYTCGSSCAVAKCGDLWGACFSGKLACYEIATCLLNCEPTDAACIIPCLVHGSLESQQQWHDIHSCLDSVCGPNGSQSCKNEAKFNECVTEKDVCKGRLHGSLEKPL